MHSHVKYKNSIFKRIEKNLGRVRWFKLVVPAFWAAQAGGSRGRQIETIVVNTVKSSLYYKLQKISWARWPVTVIPATQEAEAGELPEPRGQRLR